MRLLQFERRWLLTIFHAILPSGTPGGVSIGARDVPLDRFLDDLLAVAPSRFSWGLRATLWMAVLSPPLTLRRLKLLPSLPPEERVQALESMRHGSWYLAREAPNLLKMVACLGYGGWPEVQARAGIAPVDASLPPWARPPEGRS